MAAESEDRMMCYREESSKVLARTRRIFFFAQSNVDPSIEGKNRKSEIAAIWTKATIDPWILFIEEVYMN